MTEKVRDEDKRLTIVVVEMRNNGERGNRHNGIWIRRRRRRVMGDRRDAGI